MIGGLASIPSSSQDSGYPTRAITMIIPFAAGGPTDMLSRIVTGHMARTLGQRFVVVNVAGAGGTKGSLRTKRSVPDGYSIAAGNIGTHAAAVAVYPTLGYDPVSDFEPIGVMANAPIVILGRRDLPPKDLREFIVYVQANAHKLDEGHAGVGSASYAGCLLLSQVLGVRSRSVPHDGTGPAIEALALGQVDYMCDQVINAGPYVRAGRIKAYAIAAAERSPALPDVPTAKEAGLAQYELSVWNGIFAPKGVPGIVVERLNNALSAALADETVRTRLADLGAIVPPTEQRTPQALAALVKRDVAFWQSTVKAVVY
jgi:tripartite-type tricarboxylate transporter receptor subunit TctC